MLGPLLAFVVLAAAMQQATACSCPPSSIQERVCQNNTNTILFRGVVKSVEVPDDLVSGKYRYIMKKVKVFQDNDGVTNRRKKLRLTTYSGSSLCGMYLAEDNTWLVDAHLDSDGIFHASGCGQTKLWPSEKKEQKLLKKLLKSPDCSCSILNCSGWWDVPIECLQEVIRNDQCVFPPPNSDCAFQRCEQRQGVCDWFPSRC